MALATLSIDLVAQLAKLEEGMNKAGRLAERQSQQIADSFNGIKTVAAGIGGVLAGAFSVAGITTFIRATVDGLDRLNDLSDATGASIETLSALEDIAARTGTSMDTVGDAVVKLNKFLGEASKPGGDAANALSALGLSAAALKGLDPAEALRQVAVALSGFADDGNKARIVQELFGKSIQQVAPLLKDLAEAGRLNATVTTEQAKAAEDFNKQIFALQKNITDIARNISGPLVSAINESIARFREGAKEGKNFYQVIVDQQVKTLGFGDLSREIENLRAQLAIEPKGTGLYASLAKQLDEKTALLNASKKAAETSFRPSQNYGEGFKPALPSLPTGKDDKDKQKIFASNSFNPDDVNALKALGATDTAKIRELESALSGLFELQRETRGDAGVVAAIAKVREELEKLDPAAKAAAEAKKRLDDILSQTPSAKLDSVLVDVELLNKAFEAGKLSVEKWAEGIIVATAKLPDAVKEPLEQIDQFTRQSAANIQDALGDSLLATFNGSADGIASIWKNLLKNLLAEALAAQIGKALLGDYGKTGVLGGGIGSLIGLFGGFRAEGGPVQSGRSYIVGERGPEMFVPRGNGSIVPNNAMGGASIVINQSLSVGDGVSRGEVSSALVLAGRQIKADIMDTLYRTGRGVAA